MDMECREGGICLEVTFRQDIYNSYMILSGGEVDRTAYPIHMITRNDIPGFLCCHTEEMDGRLYFYYDVTSMRSLKTVLETRPVSSGLLRLLLQALPSAMEILSAYLLKPDGIQLSAAMIYTDEEQKKLWFCYYPDKMSHFAEALVSLGEDILSGLDHGDREAVALGYAFYQECCGLKGEVPADFFSRFLKSREPSVGTEEEACREEEEKQKNLASVFFDEDDDDSDRREDKQRRRKKKKERNGEKDRKKKSGWRGFFRRRATGLMPEDRERTPGISERVPESRERKSYETERMSYETERTSYEADRMSSSVSAESEEEEKTVLLRRKKEGRAPVRARLIAVADTAEVAGDAEAPDFSDEAVFCLTAPVYIVGRSRRSATLILSSPAVSRVHAELVWQDLSNRSYDGRPAGCRPKSRSDEQSRGTGAPEPGTEAPAAGDPVSGPGAGAPTGDHVSGFDTGAPTGDHVSGFDTGTPTGNPLPGSGAGAPMCGTYVLKDLNSRNATLVNGKHLSPKEAYRLCSGDLVTFADRLYRYEDGRSPVY